MVVSQIEAFPEEVFVDRLWVACLTPDPGWRGQQGSLPDFSLQPVTLHSAPHFI